MTTITIKTHEGDREVDLDAPVLIKTIWENREQYPHGVPREVHRLVPSKWRGGHDVIYVVAPDSHEPESFIRVEDIIDIVPAKKVWVPA